jgi:type IV pilus secretin PilQ/predicted competence protein
VRLASHDVEITVSQPSDPVSQPLTGKTTKIAVVTPETVPAPQGTPAELGVGSGGVATPLPPGGANSVTLHVDDIDVHKALEILSRQTNAHILVTPGVAGKVTVNLDGKSLDEVLAILAKLAHLTVHYENDVIVVSTLDEQHKIEEDNLPVRVYHLNYVKSSDVETMIKKLLSSHGVISKSPDSEIGVKSDSTGGGGSAGGGGGSSSLKGGGDALAGGDTLVVQDYEERLKAIDRVVAQIDVQPPQVLIEAVIVSVKLNKGMELGVNFGVLDGAGNTLGVLGNGALINMAAGFTPASVLAAGGKLANGATGGFAENTAGVKFGWTGNNTTGFIRALESFGDTKILASPRLLVLNKQPAQLHVGDCLGYITTTVNQTSSTQTVNFMNTGTQLMLRPFVSSDGMIRMEIHPERTTGAIDSNGIPQTNGSSVTTNVSIPDGRTIVIAGLIDTQIDNTWTGLPFLSRIPILGYLFRNTVDATTKQELVVILTPHILRPECPEATNYLGRPQSLGLDDRVGEGRRVEARDGGHLLELMSPPAQPVFVPPGAAAIDTTGAIPMARASSPVQK